MSRRACWPGALSLCLLPSAALAQSASAQPSPAAPPGNWRPYEAPADAPRPPEALPPARRDSEPEGSVAGAIAGGLEGVAGGSLVPPGDTGAGAQFGMRARLLHRRFNADVGVLVGLGSSLGLLGELRLAMDVDSDIGNIKPRSLRWGWAGYELALLRAPGLWHSLVEVPRVHVGLTRWRAHGGVDLGARVGFGWIGRFSSPEASRGLGGSLTPAVHATVFVGPVLLKIEGRAFVPALSPSRPVGQAEGALCVALGRLAMGCAGGGVFSAPAAGDPFGVAAASWRAGLMVGVGERLGGPIRFL